MWWMLSMALADDAYPTVQREVGAASVDWTRGEMAITAQSTLRTGAWRDRRMEEQDALNQLQEQITEAATSLCIEPGIDGRALLTRSSNQATLESGLQSWDVVKTIYHEAGGVTLEARLALAHWLRPVFRVGREQLMEGKGAIIDARNVDFEPCFAPTVQHADGQLQPTHAGTPVLFVTNPADPRAMERAGPEPLRLTATAPASRGMLTVSESLGETNPHQVVIVVR